MGSANKFFSEAPLRVVTIEHPFYLGKYPVTQAQWNSIFPDNPAHFVGEKHPVESASWHDAVKFCERATEKFGCRVRLPSEAEWEYACRAGTSEDFFFSREGPYRDDTEVPARIRGILNEYGWFDENSLGQTHPVGAKKPNAWGLYDMIGNVWEWCADYWHPSYAEAPVTAEAWSSPPNPRSLRCVRGGAWDMNAFRCRSCYRSWEWENSKTNRIGFRIAADPPQTQSGTNRWDATSGGNPD